MQLLSKISLFARQKMQLLSKIRLFAQQKKSYFVIGTGIICGTSQTLFGIDIPNVVWESLGMLLGITLKAGQNRIESSTKELIKAIEEAKKSQ